MGSLIMAGLVATALCNQIDSSRPDVGPLEPRFRVDGEMRPDGTCKTGIYLAEPLLIGRWVVFSFGKVREGFGTGWGRGSVEQKKSKPSPSALRAQIGYAGSEGLIAYDLDTGRAIELIPPRPDRNLDRIISVIHHYRWGDDRCAVVIEQLQKTGPETGKGLATDLWEWTLGTNSLKPIGNWDAAALLKLVLDPRLVDATLVKSDPQGGQTVELRDQATSRSTRIALQGPRALEPIGGGSTAVFGDEMTIIPQFDRRLFVIYRSGLALPEERQNEPRFFCVDPRSPRGHRWALSPAELKTATGTEHSWIFPIGGLSLESGLIAIGLTDSLSGPDHLVIAEGSTGRIRRVVAVPKKDRDDYRQDWIVSPEGSTVAFVADSLDSSKSSRALVTVDMKTGRVTPRFNPVDHSRYFNDLFAIDRRGRILMLLDDWVERVTLNESLSSERLFELNPPATRHDNPITAAGVRRLGDLPSLTSLALSRMEVTGDMLRELAELRGLTRLSLVGERTGDLAGLGGLSHLRSLTLRGKMLEPSDYREFARLHNLEELDVQTANWPIPAGTLEELANLTNLVSLRLTGAFSDDLSLKPLPALKNLKSFELAFLSLNDANVGVLSGFFQLERLSIYANANDATGESFKKLASLPKLRDLALSLNRNPNFDSIVSALAACRHLRRLRLANNNELSAGVLPKLGQLPELTELDLHLFGIENGYKSIEGLTQCKNLTRLRLTDYSLKPGDVEEILKLKHLKLFDHSETWDAAIGLPGILGLKTLEEFDAFTPQYRSPALTDEGLKGLEGLSNLKTLQLSGNAITDAGLTRIAPLVQLARLKLAYTYVTDRGLAALKPLSQLVELDLFDTEISDAGLTELGDFGGLQALDLGMTQITDAGLKHLARLRELRRLNLEGNSITDAGLRQLVAVQSLEDLDLAGTAITNAGLKELQSLKNLRRLVLKRTAITDAGLGDLKVLPHLSSLSLGR
jgi:internalin A